MWTLCIKIVPATLSTLRIRLQDGRFIPFLVLDFWDKNTGISSPANPALLLYVIIRAHVCIYHSYANLIQDSFASLQYGGLLLHDSPGTIVMTLTGLLRVAQIMTAEQRQDCQSAHFYNRSPQAARGWIPASSTA